MDDAFFTPERIQAWTATAQKAVSTMDALLNAHTAPHSAKTTPDATRQPETDNGAEKGAMGDLAP